MKAMCRQTFILLRVPLAFLICNEKRLVSRDFTTDYEPVVLVVFAARVLANGFIPRWLIHGSIGLGTDPRTRIPRF